MTGATRPDKTNHCSRFQQEVDMNFRKLLTSAAGVAALLIAGCASMGGGPLSVPLSGSQEVPPVNASGSGTGTITVGEDKSVTAKIVTQGVGGVAAHIHEGAAGANGPVVVPMDKTGENEWSSKAGAKLTDSQYEAYKAGRLYFNVHTPQNKGGEIRGQIRPAGSSGGGGGGMGGSTY
jgi:hypothetical protein